MTSWTQKAPMAIARPSAKLQRLPNLDKMLVKELNNPYKGAHAVIIDVTSGPDEVQSVRNCFGQAYKIMQETKGLTFKPNSKELKCRGSFTHNFEICTFECQSWKVNPSVAKTSNPKSEYVYEFRNKGLSGRDAFNYLVQHVSAALKALGLVTQFGNGFEIYSVEDTIFPESDVDSDLGDLAMPMMGGGVLPMPMMTASPKLQLMDEQLENWAMILETRKYPIYAETLSLIAKCCSDKENFKMLAGRKEVTRAVCKELAHGTDPSGVYNALHIASTIIEQGSAEEVNALVDQNLFCSVLNSLAMHSGGKKINKTKITRSATIEFDCLNLLCSLIQKNFRPTAAQAKQALQMHDKQLPQGLKDMMHNEMLKSVVEVLRACA